MACDCKKIIEGKLLERFIGNEPTATDHDAELMGYAIAITENRLELVGRMPFRLSANYPLKKGGVKRKTVMQSMHFSYCPFCGEKA